MPIKAESVTYKGLIIKLAPGSEHGAMAKLLTDEGSFSFFARGIGKISSKTQGAVQPLSFGDFTLSSFGNGRLSLKECKPIESFLFDTNLLSMAVSSAIIEIADKLTMEDDNKDLCVGVYKWCLSCLKALKTGFDPMTILAIFMAKGLNEFGSGLEVGHCVGCGSKKDIVSVSLDAGGYICRECFDPAIDVRLSARDVAIYRYIFKCGESDITRVVFEAEEIFRVIDNLLLAINDLTGSNIKSISFVHQAQNSSLKVS